MMKVLGGQEILGTFFLGATLNNLNSFRHSACLKNSNACITHAYDFKLM